MASMLREFKGEYEVRLKKINKNKENIQMYTQKITANWGNLIELHGILEGLFEEFIDIKEVAIWKAKIDRGQSSIEVLGKRFLLLGEYGFPNQNTYK